MVKKKSKKKPKKAKKKTVRYRSSITGHYVSEAYAKTHPKTTQKETG